MNRAMDRIRRKVESRVRLSETDAVWLMDEAPLLFVGELANHDRFRRHPEREVTFVVDTNPNYTNVCEVDCTFCAFYRPPGHEEAYTHSVGEMLDRIGKGVELGATTVLLQGGGQRVAAARLLPRSRSRNAGTLPRRNAALLVGR